MAIKSDYHYYPKVHRLLILKDKSTKEDAIETAVTFFKSGVELREDESSYMFKPVSESELGNYFFMEGDKYAEYRTTTGC